MAKRVFTFLLITGLAATAKSFDTPAEDLAPKVVEGPGPYNIDLDVAAGSGEERFIQVPGSASTVKGLIQFATVRPSPKWEAVAGIEVMGSKGSFYAGLITLVSPKAPTRLNSPCET